MLSGLNFWPTDSYTEFHSATDYVIEKYCNFEKEVFIIARSHQESLITCVPFCVICLTCAFYICRCSWAAPSPSPNPVESAISPAPSRTCCCPSPSCQPCFLPAAPWPATTQLSGELPRWYHYMTRIHLAWRQWFKKKNHLLNSFRRKWVHVYKRYLFDESSENTWLTLSWW